MQTNQTHYFHVLVIRRAVRLFQQLMETWICTQAPCTSNRPHFIFGHLHFRSCPTKTVDSFRFNGNCIYVIGLQNKSAWVSISWSDLYCAVWKSQRYISFACRVNKTHQIHFNNGHFLSLSNDYFNQFFIFPHCWFYDFSNGTETEGVYGVQTRFSAISPSAKLNAFFSLSLNKKITIKQLTACCVHNWKHSIRFLATILWPSLWY